MKTKLSKQEGAHLPPPVPPEVDSSEDPLLPLQAMARLDTAAGSAAWPAHTYSTYSIILLLGREAKRGLYLHVLAAHNRTNVMKLEKFMAPQ